MLGHRIGLLMFSVLFVIITVCFLSCSFSYQLSHVSLRYQVNRVFIFLFGIKAHQEVYWGYGTNY